VTFTAESETTLLQIGRIQKFAVVPAFAAFACPGVCAATVLLSVALLSATRTGDHDDPAPRFAIDGLGNPFGSLSTFAPIVLQPEPLVSTSELPSPFTEAMAELERAQTAPAPVAEPGLATAPKPSALHEATAAVPIPAPRPQFVQRRATRIAEPTPSARPAEDHRSFFDKLFGRPQQPSGSALAYAAPEGVGTAPLTGRLPVPVPNAATNPGRYTAVYDISAHTVYMPNGERLEAHSGLGTLLDDPTHVDAKNRGATPPQVYDLKLREQLFHGVEALRLTPIGNGSMYGRQGILAHSYMLGPNGDSNGCVSFRDYQRFVQAYKAGEVKQLVVVARR
jgi:hypothetical protein